MRHNKLKKIPKIILFSGVLLLFSQSLSAYDFSFTAPEIGIGQPRTLFQCCHNPALLSSAYKQPFQYSRVSAWNRNNHYRRDFDPKSERDYDLSFSNFLILTPRSTIASTVAYAHTNKIDMNRSLEKNFYDHYYAYSDTTIGDTKFAGPQLQVLYQHRIGKGLSAGAALDYAIERGLKDTYTRCETIVRDATGTVGISYFNSDRNITAGVMGTYQNRQAKYEAVKELQDALVNTYLGYYVYKPENPRSTNTKSDYRQSYRLGAHFERKAFLLDAMQLRLSYQFSNGETDVETGSATKPKPRGYWVREQHDAQLSLAYLPAQKPLGLELSHRFRWLSDWGRSGAYEVLVLEKEQLQQILRATLYYRPNQEIVIQTGAEIGTIGDSYEEYTQAFIYDADRVLLGGFGEAEFRINAVLDLQIGAAFSSYEPDFLWSTERFSITQAYLGFTRLTEWARFGVGLEYSLITAKDIDMNNHQAGISFYYMH